MNKSTMDKKKIGNASSLNRVGYIDVFRGMGILLMIMGHTNSFGGHFDKFIHAFHVPMFFVISGYLFKANKHSLLDIIKRRTKTLLVPYFIFGIIHIIRAFLVEGIFKIEYAENLLLWSKEGMPVPGTCWFLIVMFNADIIYELFDEKVRASQRHIVIAIITILGMTFQIINVRVPWGLDSSFVAVGLMHLGRLAKVSENNVWVNKILSLNILEIVVAGAVVSSVIFLTPYINMRTATYGFWPVFLLNVMGACAVGVSISKQLECAGNKCKGLACCLRYLKRIGQRSIVYLCCNQLIIESIKNYIHIENTYVSGIVLLLITCALIEVICLIIYNTKLRCIVGK